MMVVKVQENFFFFLELNKILYLCSFWLSLNILQKRKVLRHNLVNVSAQEHRYFRFSFYLFNFIYFYPKLYSDLHNVIGTGDAHILSALHDTLFYFTRVSYVYKFFCFILYAVFSALNTRKLRIRHRRIQFFFFALFIVSFRFTWRNLKPQPWFLLKLHLGD